MEVFRSHKNRWRENIRWRIFGRGTDLLLGTRPLLHGEPVTVRITPPAETHLRQQPTWDKNDAMPRIQFALKGTTTRCGRWKFIPWIPLRIRSARLLGEQTAGTRRRKGGIFWFR